MLFSSPDYPLFLIAVFFLYALARWGGPAMAWARICVMVLLGDVVFALVAKDPDALWDPIGGVLLRLAAGAGAGGGGGGGAGRDCAPASRKRSGRVRIADAGVEVW